MRIVLDYGQTGLPLDIEGLHATVISPSFLHGFENEVAGFSESVQHPIGRSGLATLIDAREQVAVVIPDITRALPNERLLGWLLAELHHVPAENFIIISGTGTHRQNTEEEWVYMVGESIYGKYRCINHRGFEPASMTSVGNSSLGYEVFLNKECVEADRRIIMGFIEPHFMAGFSGGYKAVFPGVAAVDTIMKYHSAENIGHPQSTWGVLQDNPTQENIRAGGSLLAGGFFNQRHPQ